MIKDLPVATVRWLRGAPRIRRSLLAGALLLTSYGLLGFDYDVGRPPHWTAEVNLRGLDGDSAVLASENTVLLWWGDTVTGLERRTGKLRWTYRDQTETLADDGGAVKIAGDVAVVFSDRLRRPERGRDRLTVLDLATGRALWKDDLGEGAVTVFQDGVYVAECAKKCLVSRRELRTGRTVWSLTEPSGTRVADTDIGSQKRGVRYDAPPLETGTSGPQVVLLRAGGRAREGLATSVDAATGRRLARVPYARGGAGRTDGQDVNVLPGLLVIKEAVTAEPPCTHVLRGIDLHDGSQRWRARVAGIEGPTGTYCPLDWKQGVDESDLGPPGTLVFTDADWRTHVFDLATGAVRWTLRTGERIYAADRRFVLTKATPGLGESGPVYRMRDSVTGRQLWQTSNSDFSFDRPGALVEGRALFWYERHTDQEGRGVVFDAANGQRQWHTFGRCCFMTGAGDDWFAASPYGHLGEDDDYDLFFYDLSRGREKPGSGDAGSAGR
ncbi:PQQ-binding-like beta-propeller repeat protein [Spirillospora sp. NPDC049024]